MSDCDQIVDDLADAVSGERFWRVYRILAEILDDTEGCTVEDAADALIASVQVAAQTLSKLRSDRREVGP